MAAFSARLAQVVVNGTHNLLANRWTVQCKTEEIDVTTWESNRYTKVLPGTVDAEVTVEGFWNAAQNPHQDPPNIRAGATINLSLYLNQVGGDSFDFATFLVTSVSVEAEVRGCMRLNFSGRANGSFLLPDAILGDGAV